MTVLVIDLKMNNLGSLSRALEECGAWPIEVSSEARHLETATHIVLPGNGSFADAMQTMKNSELIGPLTEVVMERKTPILGICCGMQIFAGQGTEGGILSGLGWMDCKVCKLEPRNIDERVPHVGWNEVHYKPGNPLFTNVPTRADFYFVHSFAITDLNNDYVVATTPYCGEFISAVHRDNIFGVQFHPEKSQWPGFELLRNFLKITK